MKHITLADILPKPVMVKNTLKLVKHTPRSRVETIINKNSKIFTYNTTTWHKLQETCIPGLLSNSHCEHSRLNVGNNWVHT